jgi:hypothetical protein
MCRCADLWFLIPNCVHFIYINNITTAQDGRDIMQLMQWF